MVAEAAAAVVAPVVEVALEEEAASQADEEVLAVDEAVGSSLIDFPLV